MADAKPAGVLRPSSRLGIGDGVPTVSTTIMLYTPRAYGQEHPQFSRKHTILPIYSQLGFGLLPRGRGSRLSEAQMVDTGLSRAFANGGTMHRRTGTRRGSETGAERLTLKTRRASRAKRTAALLCGFVLAATFGLGFAPTARAANPDPVQYYYIPFTEAQLLTMFNAINTAANAPITSYTTITAVAGGTLIYYDHGESGGYDPDIANPANLYSSSNLGGTQIWGDGLTSNGTCPGTSNDLITAGMVIELNNTVPDPRGTAILFDGGDKIGASKTIAVTRTSWAAGSNTLLAGSVEVYDLYAWGTDYRAPVGTNIPDATDFQMFSYTALSIMAGMDGAAVQIDADNNGTFEINTTLSEGQSYLATNVFAGAHVISDRPVQVDIFTGDVLSNYESRDSALIPTGTWSSDYYTPVSTPSTSQGTNGTDTTVWLFNSGTSQIAVNYKRWVAGVMTTSTINVAAGAYAKQVLTDGTGAEFSTSDGAPFYAFSTTDSNSGFADGTGNQAWDWGFSLVPRDRLSTQLLVGLGIGRDPTSPTNPDENGNPVWVTPHLDNDTSAATIYVDYDGDPNTGPNIDAAGHHYDVSYSLRNLERAKIYRGVPITVDQNNTASTTGATSLTVSHTTGSAANLMMVSITIGDDDGTNPADVTSVTYGSQTLTRVSSATNSNLARTAIYALANPAVGTANVTVNTDESVPFALGVTTFAGADVSSALSSALRTPATASGTTSAMTVTPASAAGDLVYEAITARNAYDVPLAVDADNHGSTTGATSLSITHTTGSTANLMLVSVAIGDEDGQNPATVNSVTYGGVAMSNRGTTTAAGTRVALYALASPAAGTANLTVNVSESVPFAVGVTTFTGADVSNGLTTALGTAATTNGTGSTMTVAPVSVAGDLVYEAVSTRVGDGPILVDASNNDDADGVTTLSVSHTTGHAANLMLVSVALADESAGSLADVTAPVTYGSQTLTRIASAENGTGTGTRAVIYALANPTPGTASVTVDTNQSVSLIVGVSTFIGADVSSGLTSALRTPNTNTGASSGMTTAMTSVAGDLVYEVVSIRNGGNTRPAVPTETSGQTHLWTNVDGENGNRLTGAVGALLATGTSTSITETQTNGPYPWAMVGVSIVKAATPSTPNEPTTTSGQTRRWTNTAINSANRVRGAGGTLEATGTSTTITETQTNGPYPWAMIGVAIHKGTASTPNEPTTTSGQTRRWTNTAIGTAGRVRGAAGTLLATGTSTTITETQTNGPYPWAMAGVSIVPALPATGDQSGMLIYTLNPDHKLAGAWGQDTLTAAASAPGLDVGTTIPPMPEISAGKDAELSVDNDEDTYLTPGDVIEYTITVYNVARLPVPDVIVYDTIPDNTTYVPQSTYALGGNYGSLTHIPDDVAGNETAPDTVLPIDGDGLNVGQLEFGESTDITFKVTVDAYNPLVDVTRINNNGSGAALNALIPVRERSYLRARLGDIVWYDEDRDGIQDAGEGPLPGVTVRLLDSAGNAVLSEETHAAITAVTGTGGKYDFKGLYPGTYMVEFEIPASYGLSFSPVDQGGDDAVDSDDTQVGTTYRGRTATFVLKGGQWDTNWDAGFYPPVATLAVIGSFNAVLADENKVVVNWTTVSEVNTAGFYLERFDARSDKWASVNRELVPALFESPNGGYYSLVDEAAQPKSSLIYRLVEMETSGSTVIHGPYQVVAKKALLPEEVSKRISRGEKTVRVPKTAALTAGVEPHKLNRPTTRKSTAANRLRIEVTQSGLYQVTVADLVTGLGVSQAKARELIRTNKVQLTSQGSSVAYFAAEDGASIYFYGQPINSIYTSTNVYWLAAGKGLNMTSAPVAPTVEPTTTVPDSTTTTVPDSTTTTVPDSTTTTVPDSTTTVSDSTTTTVPEPTTTTVPEPATSFTDTVHVEQNLMSATALFHEPEKDFWHGVYMLAGSSSMGSKTVSFDVSDVVGGVRLDMRLLGLTTVGQPNEHRVRVLLNGQLLGETQWRGAVLKEASFVLPTGALLSGANQLQLVALKGTGVAYSVVALDWFDVTYERATRAVSDQLCATAGATDAMQVSGLSTTAAWVLDISNPLLPSKVTPTSSAGDSGEASVTFNATQGHKYLVVTAAGAQRPLAVTGVAPSALKAAGVGADYVVITAPALANAAARLAAYRATKGLKTAVVTTTDIYDEFNSGVASPQAIKKFIAYAATKWKTRLRYVVLVGEGSFDYKNYAGKGDSLVPPLMVDTPNGLAPSDVSLADTRGDDGVTEVAIGRIPVLTEAEFNAALAKIKAYEASTTGTWRQSVVLLADNPDVGGDFEASSESVAAVVSPTAKVTKVYLGVLGLPAARTALQGSLSSGALLVNYAGHAGVSQLADEGLLTKEDVAASAATKPRLPIVTALTCVVGNYGLPGWDSLSEALVKRSDAGAIAVWSATALENNTESVALGRLFTQKLFGKSRTVLLGDVIRAAVQAGAKDGMPVSLLRTYCLLGDPALRVRW